MARDRANINTAIWTSDDYRDLNVQEQHMYKLLMTHPDMNYVGVVDWRPGRIAAMTAGSTTATVRAAAEALQAKRYVFIDDETEEILVRSFLRHDGLLKQPKLSISMVNAYGAVASRNIRKVLTHELKRLIREFPDWAAFKQEKVLSIIKGEGADMAAFTQGEKQDLTQGFTPAFTPGFTPNAGQAQALPTTTATTTSTSKEVEGLTRDPENATGKNGTRIPKNFTVTAEMILWATEHAPNVNRQNSTLKFKAHYNSAAGTAQFKTDWTAAWQSWLLGDQERAENRPQQFKTAAERKLENGAAMHAKYSAIEESNQHQIERTQ